MRRRIKSNPFALGLILSMAVLSLTACGGSGDQGEAAAPESDVAVANDIVTITDVHGEVDVPKNPEVVISLDNRTFETLADWDIPLAAVPKAVMPADSPYVLDDEVVDIGNHREPNLEAIAAADPDLVIIGQRFVAFYDDIKALVPEAAVIDLNIDVSEEIDNQSENLVQGLEASTLALGQIFDKGAEAQDLIAEFEASMEEVQQAYDPSQTVMTVVVSGGEIGFAAPGSGRVWGPMYGMFDWTPALAIDEASSDHKGDDISVEAIAQSDPDWILVLDRDAATADAAASLPAKDVIEHAPALQHVTAIQEGQLMYAPADTYTNESIQTYVEFFKDLAQAFAG